MEYIRIIFYAPLNNILNTLKIIYVKQTSL